MPAIPPVKVIERPVGSVGEISHETTVPPLIYGVASDIIESFVRVSVLGL